MGKLMASRPCCRVALKLGKTAAETVQLLSQQAVLQSWRQIPVQPQSASPDWLWTRRVVAEGSMEFILT
jgi:hypothetical protein